MRRPRTWSVVLSPVILIPAVLNGLMTGAVYALVALGLTLIYGVLHIINFAHGALLTAAMFAAYFVYSVLGLDPYLAAFLLAPAFFAIGYALQRLLIGPASHGDDRNMLLVTLGLAVIIENALLFCSAPIPAPLICPTLSPASILASPFSRCRGLLVSAPCSW